MTKTVSYYRFDLGVKGQGLTARTRAHFYMHTFFGGNGNIVIGPVLLSVCLSSRFYSKREFFFHFFTESAGIWHMIAYGV